MAAIEDTLDEQVDESNYTRPEIQHIFNLIEKDNITPQERAKMFDEYSHEEVKQETFQEGKEEGLKEGKEAGSQETAEVAARRLLSFGTLTEEQIAHATGLTLDRLKTLATQK